MAIIGLAAVTTTGCVFEAREAPVHGTLLVDWTIAGSKHPGACLDFAADSIDVIVRADDGWPVTEFGDYCESFAASVELSPGTYRLEAVMLDAEGVALTTAVTDRLRVYGWQTNVSAVDFPADSFF